MTYQIITQNVWKDGHKMFFTIFLLGILLSGLILFTLGVVLLLKVKNKLAGILTIAAGLGLTFVASALFLSLVITLRMQG